MPISIPIDPMLANAAMEAGLISPHTEGTTFQYGIVIRPDCQNDRKLLIHELTHTGQYERLGGIANFLHPYINECLSRGYPFGPLEQEAIKTADRLVGIQP